MFKRAVRIVLIGGVAAVLLMTLAMVWLKTHEDELVFAAERSRQHLLSALPPDAERVAVGRARLYVRDVPDVCGRLGAGHKKAPASAGADLGGTASPGRGRRLNVTPFGR